MVMRIKGNTETTQPHVRERKSKIVQDAPQLSVRISKATVNAIISGAIAIYAIVAV